METGTKSVDTLQHQFYVKHCGVTGFIDEQTNRYK